MTGSRSSKAMCSTWPHHVTPCRIRTLFVPISRVICRSKPAPLSTSCTPLTLYGWSLLVPWGVYDEVPGEMYRATLDPYRDSAALVEASDLDYTILRPVCFTHRPAVSYRVTQKGERFEGHDIYLDSLLMLIARIVTIAGLYSQSSIGVSDC